MVLGNIGAGKSTLLNKIAHCLQNDYVKNSNLEQFFESKQAAKSVTHQTKMLLFNEEIYLIDSVGYADPRMPNSQIWT